MTTEKPFDPYHFYSSSPKMKVEIETQGPLIEMFENVPKRYSFFAYTAVDKNLCSKLNGQKLDLEKTYYNTEINFFPVPVISKLYFRNCRFLKIRVFGETANLSDTFEFVTDPFPSYVASNFKVIQEISPKRFRNERWCIKHFRTGVNIWKKISKEEHLSFMVLVMLRDNVSGKILLFLQENNLIHESYNNFIFKKLIEENEIRIFQIFFLKSKYDFLKDHFGVFEFAFQCIHYEILKFLLLELENRAIYLDAIITSNFSERRLSLFKLIKAIDGIQDQDDEDC